LSTKSSRSAVSDLTSTTVYPSPRPSDRVPFGTGKAVRAVLSGRQIKNISDGGFSRLQAIGRTRAGVLSEGGSELSAVLPLSVRGFLAEEQFADVLTEIRQNTSSEAAFANGSFAGSTVFAR